MTFRIVKVRDSRGIHFEVERKYLGCFYVAESTDYYWGEPLEFTHLDNAMDYINNKKPVIKEEEREIVTIKKF